MYPSFTKLSRASSGRSDGARWLDTINDDVLQEIVKLLADGCASKGYPALCSTSKQYRALCQSESLWQDRCQAKGWDVTPPKPEQRTWFAHYMVNYCNGYLESMNKMLLGAAARGDVRRVKAALLSGADPTSSSDFIRYAVGAFWPTQQIYYESGGDMLGVVQLLLEFGPPPPRGIKQALEYTLGDHMSDETEAEFYHKMAQDIPETVTQRMLHEFDIIRYNISQKPAYKLAVLLLDYILRTGYSFDPLDPIDLDMGILAQYLLINGSSSNALVLLFQKFPGALQHLRQEDELMPTKTPYQLVLARSFLEHDPEVRYRMLDELLKRGYPTDLETDPYRLQTRYATVAAAVASDCRALSMLLQHRATFPSLNEVETNVLLTDIYSRRQELMEYIDEGDRAQINQHLCDMPAYLLQHGLIRAENIPHWSSLYTPV